MKRAIFATLILVMLIFPMTVALAAEEPAKYSFASAQGSSNLEVIPGSTAQGVVYFYNVDGNRITHIKIDLLVVPDGWTVTIDPAIDEQGYDLNGDGAVDVTVAENLFVEPTTVSATMIKDVPKGSISLTLPNKLGTDIPGYALAKILTLNIGVPASAAVGPTSSVKILATGSWLGQSGAAAIAQTREFDYTVKTVYELSGEKPVIDGDGGGFPVVPVAGGVGGAAVLVLAIVFLPRYVHFGKR